MSLFGSPDVQPPDITDERISSALADIKRDVRNKRIAMVAPLALAAAVLGAFIAAPARHGGLVLVPDAEASSNVPQVFGANGVWRFAEPIGEPAPTVPGPPWMVDFPSEPLTPDYVLDPPAETGEPSLPASASPPPTPTLGQTVLDAAIDWSAFQPVIRVEQNRQDEPQETEEPENGSPVASAPAEAITTQDSSSDDEDVSEAALPLSEPTGDVADASASETADAGSLSEANPSTPQTDLVETGAQPLSAVATIVPQSVLVHSAHVSVTVMVVDDDSSVIDWCNTRVDWGDGSVTGLAGPDGLAACTAQCEYEASPSEAGINAAGINEAITFTHDYEIVIDAAPRVYVATGDGCNYTLAEFQLNPFTVVPY